MRTRYHFNGEFLPPSKIAKILKISIGKLESYINRIPESITDNDEFERRLKKIVEDKKEKRGKFLLLGNILIGQIIRKKNWTIKFGKD